VLIFTAYWSTCSRCCIFVEILRNAVHKYLIDLLIEPVVATCQCVVSLKVKPIARPHATTMGIMRMCGYACRTCKMWMMMQTEGRA